LTGFAASIGDAFAHRHADRDAEARRRQNFSMSADDLAAISFWRSLGFFAIGLALFIAGVAVAESRALGSLSWGGIALAVIGLPMVLASGFNMLLFCAARLFDAIGWVLKRREFRIALYGGLTLAPLALFLSAPSLLTALYPFPFIFWFLYKTVKARKA